MSKKKNSILVLRTCKSDMTSYGGFKWPKRGKVQCQDWADIPECGQGLHGLLWGEGDGSLLNWDEDARWLVVKVDENEIVDIGGKVKFPSGNVVHCGDQKSATDYILAHGAAGKAVVGANVTAGHNGTATAGHNGTATAGNYGTATAGDNGTATAGHNGTATAGYNGIINIKWWDNRSGRERIATGYVGEDGIEANVPYKVENGKLVKVK